MLDGSQSGCINHPGVESTVRCKQCGKPVCDTCVQSGPTGRFCSADCRQKHETFYQQAQQLDGKGGSGTFTKVKKLVGALIVLAVALAAVGVVATVFELPVLSDITRQVRGMIGI